MNRWKLAISLGGMLGVLLLTSAATTQEDPDRRAPERKGLTQLGDMQSVVQEALRNSAEVQLAESKVRQAELELTQARMAVVRKVVSTVSDLKDAEQRLKFAEGGLDQARALHDSAMVPQAEVLQAEAAVVNLAGEIQRMKMELDFLTGSIDLGEGGGSRGRSGAPGGSGPKPAASPQPHPMFARLQQPFQANFMDVRLSQILADVLKGTGVAVVYEDEGAGEWTLTLDMTATREQWLTAVADKGTFVFVVRDYGLLLTTPDNARNYDAPTIPADFARRR